MASWLEEIIQAFENIDEKEVHYKTLYKYIKDNTIRDLPKTWQAIIRRKIQDHSSDSKGFKNNSDIFKSVYDIGHGTWKLRNKISSTPIAPDSKDYSPPRIGLKLKFTG